jgi:hypothetical protein
MLRYISLRYDLCTALRPGLTGRRDVEYHEKCRSKTEKRLMKTVVHSKADLRYSYG